MTQFEKGMIIKMSGLSVKKENGVFEINSPWEKDCSVYKLKKDGTRIKKGLDIFSYKKIEKYGQIITFDQVPAAIAEINKQLKDRKENETVVSYVSTDIKEYTNKSYIQVIQSIHTTSSIYAIPKNTVFQLTINEKWGNVTWERIGKRGEVITSGDKSLMSWKFDRMDRLFNEGYIEIVERVETVRKDIEEVEAVNEESTPEKVEVIEEVAATTETIETVETIQNELTVTNEETSITEVVEDNQVSTGSTYKLNDEKNGVEIYFDSKPSEEVKNTLKANGFRWGKYNKCWYAKQSEETISLAKQLAGEEAQNVHNNQAITEPTIVTYPEIEIDDYADEKYNISQQLQDREHDSFWVMRKNKRDHNKEIQELFQGYTDKVKAILTITDNNYYIFKLKSGLQRFKNNYHSSYVKYLTHKANNPSWVTTGRGGMNVSKYNKAMNRQDLLMMEVANLPKEFESEVNKYKNKIRKDKEEALKTQLQEELKQPLPELTFKTVTKDFDLYGRGTTVKTRFYECEGYSVAKLWGAFRVFYNGKEIYSTKSAGTLQDAKAYVQLQIKKEKQLQAG
jgi:hypothetical protein